MQLDLKCCSNLVLNSNIFEMLTPGISDKMGVLDASIATGTDDKLSLIFNTLFEHHVCSHPTSMETYSQGKFLMEIVLIALKQKNQNKCQVQVLKWWSALHRRYTDGRYQCLYTLTMYKARHNTIFSNIQKILWAIWAMNWENQQDMTKK